MSCLSTAPKGLQAVIPLDPPPSKREKMARYLLQKKEQFDQYHRLLNQQKVQLMKHRAKNGSQKPRIMSSTSFTTFAKTSNFPQQHLSMSAANDSNDSFSDKGGPRKLEDKDAEKLVMFPSYARRLETGMIEVDIRGWVYEPGLPNRKNKLFTSVIRQLVGVPAPEENGIGVTSTDADSNMSGNMSDSESIYSQYDSGSTTNLIKNQSAISVASLAGSPSQRTLSRRSSMVGTYYKPTPYRPSSPVPSSAGTAAVNIPVRPSSRLQSQPSSYKGQASRSFSPSSPSYGIGGSPRRDIYAPQGRRAGVLQDDVSGAVINNKNFVQPTLGGERQPLLASAQPDSKYLIEFSDSDSDYSSEDEEVIDNHHEIQVVERRPSQVRSNTISAKASSPTMGNRRSGSMKRTRSVYSVSQVGSSLSIAGHNSEVVAANADNAPLSSSPASASNLQSYFSSYGSVRNSSGLNLQRAFSGSLSPAPLARQQTYSVSQQKQKPLQQPPPLPPRPKLISFASKYSAEKSLQERIAPFISRPVSEEDVIINVGSTETEEYSTYSVITGQSGHFGVRLRLNYEPSIACIECGDDLITVEEVKVIEPEGVSLISDIDDTVKHTGITGAKKGIFRNVFVKDYGELEIKGVADWYQCLDKMGVPIHYVSNSPWQLYPSIAKFIRRAGLPQGSMHLKHYNGFFYGLLEPAVERKRFNLESILIDFPYRKFILVGDSGEMDLEAYVNLACKFPDQVLAIYIRDVTTICSDDDDFCNVSELNGFFSTSVPRPDEIDDLLDNSSWCCSGSKDEHKYYHRPHSPPPIMPKPASLRSKKIMTEAPTATQMQWTSSKIGSSAAGIETQQRAYESNEVPKVPKKPDILKAPTLNHYQASPNDADFLSSSAGSTASPLAQRLAAFSSTFNESSSPENQGYMSVKFQQQQSQRQQEQIHTSRINDSNKPTSVSSENKTTTSETSEQVKQAGSSSAAPPLPPRPTPVPVKNTEAGGVQGFKDKTHTTDVASFAYRACIGMSNCGGGNRDEYPLDKKVELWKRRVARARMVLPTGVRLRMWRIGDDISDECEGIVQQYLDTLKASE
ncbi:hypothetical protein V1511DRAFT_483046 [Dipodascopsis uninucleata]